MNLLSKVTSSPAFDGGDFIFGCTNFLPEVGATAASAGRMDLTVWYA